MSDAPQRRRANAPTESGEASSSIKAFRVPIAIGIIWLAVVGYHVAAANGVVGSGGPECPGHWHAGYAVHVDDQKLSFDPRLNPSFGDASGSPGVGAHIHGDDGTLHMHPGAIRCIPVGDLMEKLGVEATDSSITISSAHRESGTYTTNETHEFALYHQPWGGEWKRVTNVASFVDKQVGNGDRVLFTYMEKGSTALSAQQDGVTDLTGGNYEPLESTGFSGERIIAIIMASIFAILAVAIWNKFRSA